jgi:high-affinity nickel-transport protein
MAGVILALYGAGFTLLITASRHHSPVSNGAVFGVGTGIVALTLGMRHAFDADHIAAIDNTTRSLMAKGQRPMSVGFFFSLGHSSVVFALAVLVNFGVRSLDTQVQRGSSGLHEVANVVGTSVSGTFLLVIAAVNLAILISIVKVFLGLRHGRYDEEELERQLDQRGFMNRLFGRFAQRIDSPAKMYPIGILFGLGFDTASEVALLVLSGTAVASGLPFTSILSLPLLFAAGMSTFDAIDGCFMNFAYGWAFARPIRKVYFNITITGLSVAAAVFIGSVELLGLLPAELHWSGGAWRVFAHFNINTAGFAIVGLFAVTWVVALVIWRVFDVEQRWELAALRARAEPPAVDEISA